jgi:hypothetical protein
MRAQVRTQAMLGLSQRANTQGVTPGFTIRDKNGEIYFIKFDPVNHPEMATAAEVISTLLFYGAGYNTPENYIVHFDPKNLVIGEGAKLTDEKGKKRQMNEADLKKFSVVFPTVQMEQSAHWQANASLEGR